MVRGRANRLKQQRPVLPRFALVIQVYQRRSRTAVALVSSAARCIRATVNLYDDCPGTGPGAPGVIPGTTSCWTGVRDDGFVYGLAVDPVAPAVTIPDTVWMVVEFTTDDALWILSDQAETGFTDEFFAVNQPPWGCTFWFGGTPYAGYWSNLRAVPPGTATRSTGSDDDTATRLSIERVETPAPPAIIALPQ